MRRGTLLLFAVFLPGTVSPARAGDGSPEWIFPIVVNGGTPGFRYQTTFSFVNLSTTASAVQVIGFSDDGFSGKVLFCPFQINIGPPPDTRRTLGDSIAANGVTRLISSGTHQEVVSGWALGLAHNPGAPAPVAEISILRGPDEPCPPLSFSRPTRIDVSERPPSQVIGSIQLPAVKPALEFEVETFVTPFRETAFAIVNPNQEPVSVDFTLLDAEGEPLVSDTIGRACVNRFTLQAEERRVDFARNLAPTATPIVISFPCLEQPGGRPENFHGTARIVADGPIAVGALHVLLPDGRIVNARVTR